MHANHTQPHYAPSSVGGLMDPAFIRDAMSDADGRRRASTVVAVRRLNWRLTVLALTGWFKRR